MPGKLEFSFNSSKLGEFILDKEVMTIGRKEDNDIRIENLAVSGHHAKLLTIFEDSFLEDLDSTNGTFVNGKPIDKHPLRNGDVITIGKHELRYVNEATGVGEDEDKTVLIRKKPEQPGYSATPATTDNSIDFESSDKSQGPALEAAKLLGAHVAILAGELPAQQRASAEVGGFGDAEVDDLGVRDHPILNDHVVR